MIGRCQGRGVLLRFRDEKVSEAVAATKSSRGLTEASGEGSEEGSELQSAILLSPSPTTSPSGPECKSPPLSPSGLQHWHTFHVLMARVCFVSAQNDWRRDMDLQRFPVV